MEQRVYTIGHSSDAFDRFVRLLQQHGVQGLCDVRLLPCSRYHPQFDRPALEKALVPYGITYRFLGLELGARGSDPACYVDGKVKYERIADTRLFQSGLDHISCAA